MMECNIITESISNKSNSSEVVESQISDNLQCKSLNTIGEESNQNDQIQVKKF